MKNTCESAPKWSRWGGLVVGVALSAACGGNDGDSGSGGATTAGTGGVGGQLAESGAPCDAATGCASGHCTDGVCCESACDASCESCAVNGSEGVCTPAEVGTNPDNECVSGSCDATRSCTGAIHAWSKGFENLNLFDLATAEDGSVVAVGSFRNSVNLGGTDLVSAGLRDIIVARFERDGRHVWSKRFGTVNDEQAHAVSVDPAGNIWVTGFALSPIDFGGGSLTSGSKNDVFVLKLNPTGAHLFSKLYGNFESDVGDEIVATADGVYLSGRHLYYINFGGIAFVGPGLYLAKLDLFGQHVWSKSFGLHQADAVVPGQSQIAISAQGRIVLSAAFNGTIDLGGGKLTSATDSDVLLASFDADGNPEWSKSFAINRPFVTLATDADGAINLVGPFLDTVDFGSGALTSVGGADAFLAVFEASGAPRWSRRFGNTGTEHFSGIGVDAATGVVSVTGAIQGEVDFGGGPLNEGGETDAVLVRLDRDGTHLFSASYGGSGDNDSYALTLDGSDVVIGGACNGALDFGGGPISCSMPYSGTIARFTSAP